MENGESLRANRLNWWLIGEMPGTAIIPQRFHYNAVSRMSCQKNCSVFNT